MEKYDPINTRREFESRFKLMTNEELIEAFNKEVGNNGWASARGVYLSLLREEFRSRHFDYSAVGGDNGFSLGNKVKLVDKKLILLGNNNKTGISHIIAKIRNWFKFPDHIGS